MSQSEIPNNYPITLVLDMIVVTYSVKTIYLKIDSN